MTIAGQSGAAMLLPAFEPRMSDSARRIVRCAGHLRMFLASPEKSAWFDQHVFEVDGLLRGYAIDYISQACEDLDAHAEVSKAIAAGRAQRAPKARSEARPAAAFTRFSTISAKGGFRQASVVAPPDSLMGEKSRLFSDEASR